MSFEVELEELRQIQAIVARHEDHAFKIRNVMYALLTALTVPLFSEKKLIPGKSFLVLASIVMVLFLIVELVHRGFVRLAIDRGRDVEEMIRGKKPYDGPLIAESLGQQRLMSMMLSELRMPSIAVHYICLLAAIVMIAAVMW